MSMKVDMPSANRRWPRVIVGIDQKARGWTLVLESPTDEACYISHPSEPLICIEIDALSQLGIWTAQPAPIICGPTLYTVYRDGSEEWIGEDAPILTSPGFKGDPWGP